MSLHALSTPARNARRLRREQPGQSVEQIGKALGVKTKDLALPIVRMVDEKKLSKQGQRRGTRYFAR